MVIFPICKINLGLHVTRKRSDGFHDLETIFYPIQLTDVLEIVHQQPSAPNSFTPLAELANLRFFQTGITIEGDAANNLCIKAYQLMKEKFDHLPPIDLHLHKKIPIGAGLGGGSSDAASTLKLLNQKFHLGLSISELQQFALELGSDCPFFIQSPPSLALGRGEQLAPIELDLSGYSIVIIDSGIHISTAAAFSQVIPTQNRINLKEVIAQPINEWKKSLFNDFERPIFSRFPILGEIKKELYNAGALYSAMSGSGSSIFGIFQSRNVLLPDFSKHSLKIHWA